MSFYKSRKHAQSQLSIAKSFWTPTKHEKKTLLSRSFVGNLSRVDQIWPFLKKNYGQVLAVDSPHAKHWERFTYSDLEEYICAASRAFQSCGLDKGDVIALFSENSPRWLIVDQGIMRAGCIDAVRGASAPVNELKYILEDSNSVALVVQNSELWSKLALTEEERKRFKVVLQLEGEVIDDYVISWNSFISTQLDQNFSSQEEMNNNSSNSSMTATILYTSGTTGQPKGVPLSHANLLHQIKSLACVAHPQVGAPVLSVLPIWHAYERSAEYYFFSCGCTQTYTTIKQLKNDLPRVKPIVMATVPRLWEAIQIGFLDALNRMPAGQKRLLRSALSNSTAFKVALRKVRSLLVEEVGLLARVTSGLEMFLRWPFHCLSAKFLWPKVLLQLTGGRLRYPINGGGAIAPHVDLFFEALGVELLVGYGLTETSPVVSCRRTWRNIRGSAGQPLPDTQFQIIDPETRSIKSFREQGVVLVKGPQVMSGYLGKPEATSKVLDEDGWFDTGDLGMLLKDGSLVLTGRAKDTIVLSNGENIEPGPLEAAVVSSPLVEQVMLVGQDEKQLGILIVPNVQEILEWAATQGMALPQDLGGSPGKIELRRLLRKEINYLLSSRIGSRSDERVIGVALVNSFTIENGMLTQTLKQKRQAISARDSVVISSIYRR